MTTPIETIQRNMADMLREYDELKEIAEEMHDALLSSDEVYRSETRVKYEAWKGRGK